MQKLQSNKLKAMNKSRKTKLWALHIKTKQSSEWALNLHASSAEVAVKGIIHPQIMCPLLVFVWNQIRNTYEFKPSTLRSSFVQLKPSVLISHPIITVGSVGVTGSKYHFL
jgi:hypothetical protein